MENLSHSLPKKGYRDNGFAGKTVYDDVFGGPPKFGVPTLSPRLEDYSEIFEGFHGSRGSSIPILELPAVDAHSAADLFFDVRSSDFDYSEVFGGFNGLDFAVSYEDLFKKPTAADDSSDEVWTPAQSESLYDESDRSACSEKNPSLSSGDLNHSYDDSKKFKISYHQANPKGNEDTVIGLTHVTQVDSVPGYSFMVNETFPAHNIEDENSHLHFNRSTNFGGGVLEGKLLRKTVSQPFSSDFGVKEYETEPNPLAGNDKANSSQKAFISVSDINLRTQPSHLPPPSRPPPSFAGGTGNSSRLNSKFKASKSYAFERMEADSSPPYFDVEIDASSSAAASAAAMKDAMEKAQAQLRSAKELMERKKESLQSRTKPHAENEVRHEDEKTSEFDRIYDSKGERVQSICEREGSEMKPCAAEQRKKVKDTTHVASNAIDGQDHIDVAGKYSLTNHGKEFSASLVSHETDGSVAWREETQFYEVVETNKIKDDETVAHKWKTDCGAQEKGNVGALERQKYNRQTKTTRMDLEWAENREKFEVIKGPFKLVENKGKQTAAKGSTQKEHKERSELAQKGGEWQEKKARVSPRRLDTDKRLNEFDKHEDVEILRPDQLKEKEVISQKNLKGFSEEVRCGSRIKEAHENKVSRREMKEACNSKEYERELKEDAEQVRIGPILKETLEHDTKAKREKEVCNKEVNERKQEKAHEIGQNAEEKEEAVAHEGKAKRPIDVGELEESKKGLKVDIKQQEHKCASEAEQKKNSNVVLEQGDNAERQEKASEIQETEKRLNDGYEGCDNENRLKEAWEKNKKGSREIHENDASEKGTELLFKEEGTEDVSDEASERAECLNNVEEGSKALFFRGQNCVFQQMKGEENDRNLNLNQGVFTSMEGQKAPGEACISGETVTQASQVAGHDKNHGNLDTDKAPRFVQNETMETEPSCEREMEAVERKNELIEEKINSSSMDKNDFQHERTKNKKKDESLCPSEKLAKFSEDGVDIKGIQTKKSNGLPGIGFDTQNADMLTHKQEGRKDIKGVQYDFIQEENKDKFTSSQVILEHGMKVGDVQPAQKFTSLIPGTKEMNLNEKVRLEERKKDERVKKERDLENDRLRKIEEEKEREKEREKDRMAVDTATREARERAYAEARERAERAAVERATAEVRQRALAEARERLEKASAEARERLTAQKASAEARSKAERAAVERATAEARERAFEKAMADKASFEARERVERSVADKVSAYSANGGLRHSSSSSDLPDFQYQSFGSSRDLKYSYSSVHGLEVESAQRCKARLERHQRTAERAAKALAEKNMRDLLAQKEQAEKNRFAEALDADVKRWSSGKEGNLRALLSTLQYILGPDSGWQPIPLTEVITAVAVKKAYRKATLCVHPDKLQQRGASIQQKYICEKVFDLLKEAWSKFNSQER